MDAGRTVPRDTLAAEQDFELREVIMRLVRELHPERIILFGSRARGTQSRHSDLDLFIVIDTEEKPLDRIGTVMRHLPPSLSYGVDVIVYRPEELAERKDTPFIRRLLAEGVTLYERDES